MGISSLTTADSLQAAFPGLTQTFGTEFISTIAYALSALFLSLFTSLTPFVFQWGGSYKGSRTNLEIVRFEFASNYSFQLFYLLIFFLIVTNLLDTIKDIWENPKVLITEFATALSNRSTWYINYIVLNALFMMPFFKLVRPFEILVYALRLMYVKSQGTPRDFRSLNKGGRFWQGYFFAQLLVFYAIGVVFSTSAPLVIFASLIYFIMANITNRYRFLFTYDWSLDYGGGLFRSIFVSCAVALVLYQFFFIGTLLVRNHLVDLTAAAATVPSIVIVIVFQWAMYVRFGFRNQDTLGVDRARKLDVARQMQALKRQKYMEFLSRSKGEACVWEKKEGEYSENAQSEEGKHKGHDDKPTAVSQGVSGAVEEDPRKATRKRRKSKLEKGKEQRNNEQMSFLELYEHPTLMSGAIVPDRDLLQWLRDH